MLNKAAYQSFHASDESPMLHRVGEAVALQWRHLPETVREVILNQAETLAYRDERAGARDTLKRLLERYAARAH